MTRSSVIRKVGFWDSALPIWVVYGRGEASGCWSGMFYVLVLELSDPYGSGRVRDRLSRLGLVGMVLGQLSFLDNLSPLCFAPHSPI